MFYEMMRQHFFSLECVTTIIAEVRNISYANTANPLPGCAEHFINYGFMLPIGQIDYLFRGDFMFF